jgi:hypothetical protein
MTLGEIEVESCLGIGRPEILRKIGVEMKIELDGVGENVQDHT